MAVERSSTPRASLRAGWAQSGSRALFPLVLVVALWRLPSLVEPPWVNDEGTYFAVAAAMAHGLRLYAQVWENKPPGLYLAYLAVYHLVGPSLIAVRILALGAALGATILTYLLARKWLSNRAALAAALLAGLLFDVPFLEGTTANAEIFLAFFVAVGMYLGVTRRPELAAIAMLFAVSFKAVALLDASALALWYLWRDRQLFARYLTVGLIGLAAGALLLYTAGILGPFLRDGVLYDLGYVGHGNGGSLPWALGLKVLGLVIATALLRRAPLPALWLVWALAGALVSGRVFGHYFLEVVVPFATVTSIVLGGGRLRNAPVLLPAAYLALAAASAAVGWGLAASGHDSILARRLQYYANAVRYGLGLESRATYRSQVDDHVNRNLALARAVRTLPAGRLLIWGNTPWIYVLSDRMAATPYTSALRSPLVPGETADLRRGVERGGARVVIVIRPAAPALGRAKAALRSRYRAREKIDNATIYVRRSSA